MRKSMIVAVMLLTMFAEAQELAVWGWRTKVWQSFLSSQMGRSMVVLPSGEGGRIPVEEFAGRRVVVLDQGGQVPPITEEELQVVRRWVTEGGRLLLFSGTPASWLRGESVYDLRRGAELLGAGGYIYSEFEAQILAPSNPLLAALTHPPYQWFKSAPGLNNIGTARVLIGARLAGGVAGRLTINQLGAGVVVYCSPVLIAAYKDGWEADAELASQVGLLRALVGMCLDDKPAVAQVLASAPARKTQVVRLGDKLRHVAVRAEGDSIKPAGDLVRYLNLMTNGELTVNDPTALPDQLTILVGRSEEAERLGLNFAELHPYGYFIKLVGEDNLVLAGRNVTADAYAVFDFLKRFAGYRYFGPGELGEIVPRQEAIALPKTVDITETPSLVSYTNAGLYGGNGAFFRSWRTTLLASHWLGKIYPPEKYGQQHPEYYTMVDGKRFVPPPGMEGTWQPCVSNPDLPAIAVEYAATEWFPKHPEALGFSVGVNDGGGDCHCPECEKWREQYGNPYIPFYNEIGRLLEQRLPGKLACFIAYGGAAEPPHGITLEPNLYVEVCSGLQDDLRLLRQWHEAGARHLGLYDYLYGGGYVLPRHYPHIMGEAWKRAHRDFGLSGAWTESFIQVWLYDGPRQYVLNELAWDMDQDIDALLADYFEKFYCEAAAPMRAFFDRLEAIYARRPDPLHPMTDWKSLRQMDQYTREDREYLRQRLDEARGVVRDRAAAARLELMAKIFGLSDLYLQACLAARDLSQLSTAEVSDPDRIIALVSEGMGAVNAIDAYTMTEAEEKAIFTNTNLDGYRNEPTLKTRPLVEREADRALELITRQRLQTATAAQVRDWWRALAARPEHAQIRPLLLTQAYLAEHPEGGPELIPSPSFELEGAPAEQVLSDADLQKFDWARLDQRLPGWSTWHFQQSVTRFYWDPTEAHTGSRSLSVRENQIAGCFQTAVRVTPGARYRLSFWVKQQPPDRGGSMSIRWMNEKGWADQGAGAVARITVEYPKGAESTWRQVVVTFTAPEGVTSCIPLFSAPRQTAVEGIWFDDISMVQIYDPALDG